MLLLVLLLSPWGAAAQCFAGTNSNGDPIIKLGMLYSGAGTSYATKSGDLQDGYNFGVRKVNDDGGIECDGVFYKLEITQMVDDNSNKANAKDNMQRLINTGVDFVLAPYSSSLSAGASEACEANNMVIIYPGASADSLFNTPAIAGTTYDAQSNDKYGEYNFGLFTPASQYQNSIIDKLAAIDLDTKVCIMARDSSFPISVAQGALDYAKSAGLKVSGDQNLPYIHTDLDQTTIDLHIAACRDDGADVLLACTNKDYDAKGYTKGLKDMGWYPKAVSITVYGSEHSFVDLPEHGDSVINLLGPTQWSPDMSGGNAAGSVWGTARDIADLWIAQGYGNGDGFDYTTRPGTSPFTARNPPSYQGAGAAAAIMTLKLAIEKAQAASTFQSGNAMTNMLVMGSLKTLNAPATFWGPIAFAASGQILGDNANSPRQMFATQVQLNNKGEIPVVLPVAHSSIKDDTVMPPVLFEIKYPSVLFNAYNKGLSGAGHQDRIDDLQTQALECEADKGSGAVLIASVCLNVLLLCGVAIYFLRPQKDVVMVGGSDDNL